MTAARSFFYSTFSEANDDAVNKKKIHFIYIYIGSVNLLSKSRSPPVARPVFTFPSFGLETLERHGVQPHRRTPFFSCLCWTPIDLLRTIFFHVN